MNFLENVGLFILGWIIGVLWWHWVLIPIFYGFPKAIYYTAKRFTTPKAIWVALRLPIIVLLVMVAIIIVFQERSVSFFAHIDKWATLANIYLLIGVILSKRKWSVYSSRYTLMISIFSECVTKKGREKAIRDIKKEI